MLLAGAASCAPAEPTCNPGDEGCDGLAEPCVADEAPGLEGPSSKPLGLAEPLTNGGNYRIWPDGRIPYVVGASVGGTTKSRLFEAMDAWESKTGGIVRFEEATSEDAAFVKVREGSPRVSFVGYKKETVLTLYLRNPEYITVIRHELGHVLGLHHEHRRSDRADHIQYKPQNLVATSSCEYQFKICSDCTLVGDYQVGSVMHYRSYRDLAGCRIDGKAVLLNQDGSAIDHDWVITEGDAAAIEELYGGSGGSGGKGGAGGAPGVGGSGATTGGPSEGGENASGGAPPAAVPTTGEGGCALSTPGAPAPGWVVALAFAAFVRRRRLSRL